jgi:hypothetical protein
MHNLERSTLKNSYYPTYYADIVFAKITRRSSPPKTVILDSFLLWLFLADTSVSGRDVTLHILLITSTKGIPLTRTPTITAAMFKTMEKEATTLASDSSSFDDSFSSSKKQPLARGGFPQLLLALLKDAESDGNDHIVSWTIDGLAFKVHQRDVFMKQILPNYFGLTKYNSFARQLQLWGFAFCKGASNPKFGACKSSAQSTSHRVEGLCPQPFASTSDQIPTQASPAVRVQAVCHHQWSESRSRDGIVEREDRRARRTTRHPT